ncbi:MAG: hypothetical protein AAF098_19070 [Pseudomonadota bacterium]
MPSRKKAEVQVTASSGYTGTIYGAIVLFEESKAGHFVATVRAPYKADGDEAIKALLRCTS